MSGDEGNSDVRRFDSSVGFSPSSISSSGATSCACDMDEPIGSDSELASSEIGRDDVEGSGGGNDGDDMSTS